MLRIILVVLLLLHRGTSSTIIAEKRVRAMVRAWAPLVWLAPGEKFLPLGVPDFLNNVKAGNDHLHTRIDVVFFNSANEMWLIFLRSMNKALVTHWTAKKNFDAHGTFDILVGGAENAELKDECQELLLRNESSFIYGKEPAGKVPVYALVEDCTIVESPFDKKKKSLLSSVGNTNEISSSDERGANRGRIRRKIIAESVLSKEFRGRVVVEREKTSRDDDLANFDGATLINNDLSGNEVVTRADTIRLGNSIPLADNRLRKLHFHVTYWMFYPFSEGKAVCVLDLGFFGSWPIPKVGGVCLGSLREYGNHVGDWEHMSLYFKGTDHPSSMYVSAHDAGAFYRYDKRTGTFLYERQETREGIFQKPIFPERVFTSSGDHPVLFSARGSHGLWTAPGKHKFVRLPRLYDESGFGIPWPTWKRIEVLPTDDNDMSPAWMTFRGKWGNPRSNCHPLVKLGFNICEFVDGPTGIPTKKGRFQCQR